MFDLTMMECLSRFTVQTIIMLYSASCDQVVVMCLVAGGGLIERIRRGKVVSAQTARLW